jgi:L-ascorbate metabolism protein UlaG (beta-lactamase superfamily)
VFQAVRDLRAAFGARPEGQRLVRVTASPHYRDGAFRNTDPATMLSPGQAPKLLRELLFGKQKRKPSLAIPVTRPDFGAPAGELDAVWLGHATTLVEIEGRRVLLDPVWSERCSPASFAGPRRMHPMPLPIDALPALDAIVISHDHYDHLDLASVRVLTRSQQAPFLVPLGVGSHLQRWGVPPARIVELDWDDEHTVAGLRIVATEARHFSGRSFKRDYTLWGSWVIAGARKRVFYTGDSGYFSGYATIGADHGPFDLTLVQIGAYGAQWPDIHMTPEDAVTAHQDLGGGLLLPVHWATFNLAMHAWSDPVDRIWQEAKARDVTLAVPRPGERIAVAEPPTVDGWWQVIA